ncbi:MAG: methylmalonyl Co-A mutase-associated GTPase MeaB, partial [Spirochaetaceae bacterium]|nr:methylmalonyl Co-A mutase-associated GTPase MeaB [Spirochaetaceae bacterium]
MLDAATFTAGRERREVRVLARMITLAENQPREAYSVLSGAGIPPGDSHVLGVTGPPGVGKSSLVNAMMTELRAREETIAVLAVDPSSPFRGGALLGDRIRMNLHAADPGVYIRSMATRGVLGGLSRAAWIAVRILATWGFDWIVIETAGVGQSEIDVVDLADTTVLVLSPGLGDDVQVM